MWLFTINIQQNDHFGSLMTWPCYIENRTIVRRVTLRLNSIDIVFQWRIEITPIANSANKCWMKINETTMRWAPYVTV